MKQQIEVTTDVELAEGTMAATEVDGRWIGVARADGELYGFDDECSHDECPLTTGSVIGREVECECHGARFDLRTGAVTKAPATEPIRTYPARVEDGKVVVELEP